ncbi:MAG: hypothetical protein VB115_01030 [Christensenellaceae bacterium]|nr:hypothetical protein [Christensenellaceae bacterium]
MTNRFEPWRAGPRIQAMVGHYGSGKSEIALSLAIGARADGRAAAVVDLDIVNPFFRSAEQGALLNERGVELIAPPYALTGVDLPVLAPDVMGVFARPELFAVLDVGGDDAGAAALGGYKPYFDAQSAALNYVVNPFRPYSATLDQIIRLMGRVAGRARMKVTGLINNANLGRETEPAHLIEGQKLLEQVSAAAGVPVVCACALPAVLAETPDLGVPVLAIERRLMPEWLEDAAWPS